MNYFIRNMVYEDIDEVKTLIPKNWGDSTDILIKYVNDKNAHPIVVERDAKARDWRRNSISIDTVM